MSEGTAPKEHFAGVFSLQKTIKIGAGATSRRVAQSSFFFVRAASDDSMMAICRKISAYPKLPARAVASFFSLASASAFSLISFFSTS